MFGNPEWPKGDPTRLVVPRRSPRRRRRAARPKPDLLEPWETEVDERTARAHIHSGVHGFPYGPRRIEDVPDGAFAALRRAVGATDLRHLFVVPARTRPGRLGGGRPQILTPTGVLGSPLTSHSELRVCG